MDSILKQRAFTMLSLGTVKPRGWLMDQLRIQADGLSGHLDEGFFPDLGPDSGWRGGNGESWEVGPYWLDGLVPLAWLLEDKRLQLKALKWINWSLVNLRRDGWIGPETNHEDKWWPRAVMCKVLAQYAEASNDWRPVPAIGNYLELLAKSVSDDPLRQWAVFRWGEHLPTLLWLMERKACPFAVDLAHRLWSQGYNWSDHFNHFLIERHVSHHPNLSTHVVNHGMAVKYPALWHMFSHAAGDRKAVDAAFAMLDRFHGQATGIFSGDEHLAGTNPSRGTELCAVVELMYSLEWLTSILGTTAYADRLESVAYNNLPGTFTADMWAHQYDQQANQVQCTVAERPWTNGPDANIFGLAPNYKCCTANFSQGWPKFVANMWMGSPDGGLAAVAYGPSEVTVTLGDARVTIVERTTYPFSGLVEFDVDAPNDFIFPLYLRIPGWANGAEVRINGERPVDAEPGTFHMIKRRWKSGDRITLELPMNLRVDRRHNNAASVHRGPLAFSLRIGARWKQLAGEAPHADYEVHPTTKWNYALVVDDDKPGTTLGVTERSVRMPCFSEINAPVIITARARELPEWGLDGASAAPPPASPVRTDGPVENVQLIPYGAAKLRITEFPTTAE